MHEEPHESNKWMVDHALCLIANYKRLTGLDLLGLRVEDAVESARALYHHAAAVLSHNTADDPIFDYANLAAQQRFDMEWASITSIPSRQSAEPMIQEERQRLMDAVRTHGYIDDYSGIRISASGRRFFIPQATVWNLQDAAGDYCGQAAVFSEWEDL